MWITIWQKLTKKLTKIKSRGTDEITRTACRLILMSLCRVVAVEAYPSFVMVKYLIEIQIRKKNEKAKGGANSSVRK